MLAGALPLCSGLRISEGCDAETGLLPCQFNWRGAFGDPPPGTRFVLPDLTEADLPYEYALKGGELCTHGHNGLPGDLADLNVCLAREDTCHKKVRKAGQGARAGGHLFFRCSLMLEQFSVLIMAHCVAS